MRVPEDLRKSVVFVLREEKNNNFAFVGTGFLVSKPFEKIPRRSIVYLVTAKHVVAALQGRRFAIRINKKETGSELLLAERDSLKWYEHPNHSESPADVSVIRMPVVKTDHLDFRTIPIEIFLKEEELQKDVGVGEEVFIVGLFSKLFGQARNLPIVRVGNIAMIPEEKVPTTSFGDMDAYLVEARSLGGLSGSPVFTTQSGVLGKRRLYLLGLIHGHWDIPAEFQSKLMPQGNDSEDSITNPGVNMGIAIVVPAVKIRETIEQTELIEQFYKQQEDLLSQQVTK